MEMESVKSRYFMQYKKKSVQDSFFNMGLYIWVFFVYYD